jgi:cytosine/adenosine deaminase-related metal-dependent hydrolase
LERGVVTTTIRARWVFPADASPIADGRVTIRGDRILDVADDGPADLDVGNAALLPGFVNAHTHLDLGMLAGRCRPTPDLPAWLRCVIAGRLAANPDEVQQGIVHGSTACVRSGTTLVGDISGGGGSWNALAASPLRAVVFFELLGLPAERADQAWERARAWLETTAATPRCRPGLSPHAPYSVHRELYRRTADWAQAHGLPWSTHLAESQAELQLLREHAGPFADFLRGLDVWDEVGLVANPAEVLQLSAELTNAVLAHGNYLPANSDLSPGHTIVYCPRTHAAFGHAPHPLPWLMRRSVRVALGTDSLASNPDLDVLAEARHLHARFPEISGDALVRMLTFNGARALGFGGETGSLTPGKFADLVVLPLPDVEPSDPHTLVWESPDAVQGVMIGGVWELAPP